MFNNMKHNFFHSKVIEKYLYYMWHRKSTFEEEIMNPLHLDRVFCPKICLFKTDGGILGQSSSPHKKLQYMKITVTLNFKIST